VAQQKIEAAAPGNARIVHYDDSAEFKKAIAGGTGFDWIKQEMQAGKAQENKTAATQPGRSSDAKKDLQQ
jgi:hypothetical protein